MALLLSRRVATPALRAAARATSAASRPLAPLQRRFWSATPAPAPASDAAAVPAWRACHRPLTLQPVLPYVPRTVPAHIPHPHYVSPSNSEDPRNSQFRRTGIEMKDSESIARMRRACKIASRIRAFAGELVRPGRTTDEIDAALHAECVRLGVYPSPLGYAGFPKSVCTSVNQVVVHGIPDARELQEGDIVNIDVSIYADGYHGDCSAMFVAGSADPLAAHLLRTTRACLDGAIALCGPGVPFSAVGAFIRPMAAAQGFSVVRQFCGHGIGADLHMPPLVYHLENNVNDLMQPGMTFTIEPILNEGTGEIEVLSDGWTFVTRDGGRSAQYEETILITPDGHEVLTRHTGPN